MRIVIAGAGFGGLEVASTLSDMLGTDADIVLIDRSDGFVPGAAHIPILLGQATADEQRHTYADAAAKPGVRFVRDDITAIDPERRAVTTAAHGEIAGDALVLALGAELDPAATPGLAEALASAGPVHEFYSLDGALAAHEALETFTGGDVVIAAATPLFKCPPAPSAAAILLDEQLRARELRGCSSITVALPGASPIPPSPEASEAVLGAFGDREIRFVPNGVIHRVDGAAQRAHFTDGSEIGFDLLLAIPTHRVPDVVRESGLASDGWIPVDAATGATDYPGVYALGDVANTGTPKAGAFAAAHAPIVARRLLADLRNQTAGDTFDGAGSCYMAFGGGDFARIDVSGILGEQPVNRFTAPSSTLAEEMTTSAQRAMQRWFGENSPAA